jgi:hypothetical protein
MRWKATARNMLARASSPRRSGWVAKPSAGHARGRRVCAPGAPTVEGRRVPSQGLLYTATYAIRISPPETVFLVGDVQLQIAFGNPPPIARSKMMKNG